MTDADEANDPKMPFSLFDVADIIGIGLAAGGAIVAFLAFLSENYYASWIAAGLVPAGFGLMLTARIGRALNKIAETNAAILEHLDDRER